MEPSLQQEASHILVGTRIESHIERVARAEKRLNVTQEEQVTEKERGGAALATCKRQQVIFGQTADVRFDKAKLPKSNLYYTSHQGVYRNPLSVTFNGDCVSLDDGSSWAVRYYDRYKTLDWLTSDCVIIMPNSNLFSLYDFCLFNLNTGAAVQVNLYLGPLYTGLNTYWVTAIDDSKDIIYLNDGSSWGIPLFDSFAVSKWLLNDTVILGVNNDPFSIRPNILINVNILNYASVTCLN